MKALLILWAMGLAACDKLDRTYLPPSGSIASGGNIEDLNLPLEFPKENYPSTLKPENNSESTRKPYAFTQTTTLASIENYETTIGSANNQEYSSTVSPYDKNLNYPHQIVDDLRLPGISFDTKISRVIPQNAYTVQSSINANFSPKMPLTHMEQIQHNSNSDVSVHGDLISPNRTSEKYSTARYPSKQYEGNFDSTSGVVDSNRGTTPESYYDPNKPRSYGAMNQQNNAEDQYYSTPQTFENIDRENKSYASKNTYGSSILIPNNYAEVVSSTSAPIKSSSAYLTMPKHFYENFGSNYIAHIPPDRPQAASDRNAVISKYENILTPEAYAYTYDTSNGIHADESGTANNGVKAQGSYSYIGDDGQFYNITYTADENGFLPYGDHLPTAPPVPDAILKVIEEAENNRKLGVIDDGTYDDSKYGHARYQGLFGYNPKRPQFSGTYREQPINRGYMSNTKTISIENKDTSDNDRNRSDQVNISHQVDELPRRPYYFYADNDNKEDDYKNEEALSANDANQFNERRVPKVDKVEAKEHSFITRTTNKSTDDSVTIYGLPQGHYVDYTENSSKTSITSSSNDKLRNGSENLPSNPNIYISKAQVTSNNVRHDNNVNMPFHTGYEYTRPQQTFNDNYENKFQFGFPNPNEETVKPIEDETRNPQTIVNTFVSPKIQTQELQPAQQLFRNPMTTFGQKNTIQDQNGKDHLVRPILTTFSNGVFKISDDEPIVAIDELFQSTSKPEYGTTISYNRYPYRTTVSENERRYYYPTSTLSTEYISPTTPLPSEFSSPLPPSTIGFYPGTTPATSQFSSTARPVMDSQFIGSTTHRPDHTLGSKFRQRPDKDDRVSITSPGERVSITTLDRINGKHKHRGKPRIPETINKFQEFIKETPQKSSSQDVIVPEFVIPDHRTHNFKISTGPKDHGAQTSTERVIGEDFSGPKQLQRFDPVYGYYY